MFTYTVHRNQETIFETNDLAEARKFFRKRGNNIAIEYNKMANSTGFKASDKLVYRMFRWDEDPEAEDWVKCLDHKSFDIKDWVRIFY